MKLKTYLMMGILVMVTSVLLWIGCDSESDPYIPPYIPPVDTGDVTVTLDSGILGCLHVAWKPIPGAVSYKLVFERNDGNETRIIPREGPENNGDHEPKNDTENPIDGTSITLYGFMIYGQAEREGVMETENWSYTLTVYYLDNEGIKTPVYTRENVRCTVPEVEITKATPSAGGQIILEWELMEWVSHYDIKWGTSDNINLSTGNGDTHNDSFEIDYRNTFNITGLTGGTTYYIWVIPAVNLDKYPYNGQNLWMKNLPATRISCTAL